MAIQDTAEQIVAVIPVAVTAGMAMRMMDRLMPQQQYQQPVRRKKKQKDVYSSTYYGNFSNIGW